MLTVQPVNFKPAFKSGYAADIAYNREYAKSPLQEEWEGYKSEFENLASDENLPKPMRKFAKFRKNKLFHFVFHHYLPAQKV